MSSDQLAESDDDREDAEKATKHVRDDTPPDAAECYLQTTRNPGVA